MLHRFVLVAYILLSLGSASAQAPFYQGKTITIIQGRDPGGTGEDATPLLPEDNERAIRDIPRDSEVIEIFKKLIAAGPLPGR